ncbi:hypothetical protein [Curtobacterium ammoniigenes]|uniref:hypothetical protein n=1 Tax=Curtobacterium ammoniigenes TaxID=395387 RepID=UPI00082F5EEE|nr:hypothetical protein [Curtobacterium ammoniigenes]
MTTTNTITSQHGFADVPLVDRRGREADIARVERIHGIVWNGVRGGDRSSVAAMSTPAAVTVLEQAGIHFDHTRVFTDASGATVAVITAPYEPATAEFIALCETTARTLGLDARVNHPDDIVYAPVGANPTTIMFWDPHRLTVR